MAVMSHAMCAVEQNEAIFMPETKEELVMNIMNSDDMESEEFPMSTEIIAREEKKYTHLKEVMKKSDKFSEIIIERSTVVNYDNKIYIPQLLKKRLLWWYHTYLKHPVITHIEANLIQNLTWTNLRKDVEAADKNCHECQIGKKVRKKYGDLREKLAERAIAWNRDDIDLIGPLKITTPSGKK
jgi:hypothetical protein